MSVNELIDLLKVEKSRTTLTSMPEEISSTDSLTTDTRENKAPEIIPRNIKEKMDSHDDNSELEEEDEIVQYLNEKIRKLDEQISLAN